MSYEEKCRYFKVQTLSSRRNISDVVFLNKLFNNKIDCNPILREVSLYVPSRRLRQRDLFLNRFRLNIRKNSPLIRAQAQINASNLDVFDNVVAFKRQAKSYFSVPWIFWISFTIITFIHNHHFLLFFCILTILYLYYLINYSFYVHCY